MVSIYNVLKSNNVKVSLINRTVTETEKIIKNDLN